LRVPFCFRRLEIPEVILIESQRFRDERGVFLEAYQHSAFAAHGITGPFVQDNLSQSLRHVLRGLHYQKSPAAQAKLLHVVRGEIYDVVVDIRRGSPSYGRWAGVTLTAAAGPQMLYVPVGFAHGFVVLSEEATVLYKTTAEYAPELERGIRWNDPALRIAWPVRSPVLNARDAGLPTLAEADNNFTFAP
jgi:dTDP-4-dehydrorhamnose 3,5-epimerase